MLHGHIRNVLVLCRELRSSTEEPAQGIPATHITSGGQKMSRNTLSAIALASLVFVASGAAQADQATPPPQHQHPAADKATPQAHDMMAKCKAAMADHETMMANMKAADQRLDELAAKMTSASGPAKLDATAAVVSEIVAQRKAMRESMMKMHHGMMGHMAEHMQTGAESMAMCPMMKDVGAMKMKK
jgi:ATP phosphoribosyltransferase